MISEEPKYTLGDDDENLKIAVFYQYGDFSFDSFYILEPSESKSQAWEVWYAEWKGPDLKQANLIRKLVEIRSSWITKTEHVHLVCQSLALGYEVGEYDGETRIQALNRFAIAALTGKAGISELNEAAHQADLGITEDGSNFSNRGAK